MTKEEFEGLCDGSLAIHHLSNELRALCFDRRGDWKSAHEAVQDGSTPGEALVHAYLHRKEGDHVNARYWYQRAGRKMPKVELAEEWAELVAKFL